MAGLPYDAHVTYDGEVAADPAAAAQAAAAQSVADALRAMYRRGGAITRAQVAAAFAAARLPLT